MAIADLMTSNDFARDNERLQKELRHERRIANLARAAVKAQSKSSNPYTYDEWLTLVDAIIAEGKR